MKLLVAIKTCHRLDYYVDDQTIDWLDANGLRISGNQPQRVAAIRDTWLRADVFSRVDDLRLDYKFFYGTRLRRLDVKPNQRLGTAKPAEPLREPLSDEIFLNCGDNYTQNSAKLKEIVKYALAGDYDYVLIVDDDTFVYPELFATEFPSYDYAGGSTGAFHPGSCVFLSRTAMTLISQARITTYADDAWVGDVMSKAGIPRHDIVGVVHGFGVDYKINPYKVSKTAVSLHSCMPDVMRTLWTRYTTALLAQQKATAGNKSDPMPSVSPSQDFVAEKSFSPVTSPTSPVEPSPDLDLKSSTTPAPLETQSTNDSESSVIGSQLTNETSDSSSTVTSET